MPKILMPYTVHLDHTLRVTPVSTLFYKGDSNAHRFELNVLSKGLQADLSGCTAVYRFYRLQDSTVVSNPASIESGKVVAVLDKACYDYIGRFALTIAIQNGEDETTVFYGDGYMSGNRADTGITGDYVVYDVETLLAKIAEIDTAIANANTAIANANTATENANAAEAARADAEAERVAAENYRVGHESTRQMHENDRVAHEKTRISSETTRRNAETERAAAETARSDAETARAEAEQQRAAAEEARDAAETDRESAEQARAAAEQARQETFAGYEERIVAATPDDTTVDGRAWTSKKTVDSLCMPFEASGNPVQVYPVEGYPLGVKVNFEPAQAGSGDPSPDNIRPITGLDAVSVTRCGENMLNPEKNGHNIYKPYGLTITYVDDNKVHISGTFNRSGGNFVIIDTQQNSLSGRKLKITGFTIDGTNIDYSLYGLRTKDETYIAMHTSAAEGTIIDMTIAIVVSQDTPLAYTPYTGSTTDIVMPHTVYGGTLDVGSGEGQYTWKKITIDGSESWKAQATNTMGKVGFVLNLPEIYTPDISNVKGDVICNQYPTVTAYDTYSCINGISVEAKENRYIRIYDDIHAVGTIDEWKSYLASRHAAGTPVQICYKLKEPDPFNVSSSHTINALYGVNTLYTDAGTLTVTGREDPRHTIVTLTDRIAALESAAAGV